MASNKVTKLEMSLDDIIKQSKKSSGKKLDTKRSRMIRSRKGNARRSNPLSLKKKQGIIKRNSGVALARGLNNSRRGRPRPGTKISRNIQSRGRSNTLSKAATANLVKKLVQKALRQAVLPRNTGRKPMKVSRGLGRQKMALNRVSQRSRAIINRPRIVALPVLTTSSTRGRNRRRQIQPIQFLPVIGTVPNIKRGNRNRPHSVAQRGRQTGVGNRFQTIRQQISALRRSDRQVHVKPQTSMGGRGRQRRGRGFQSNWQGNTAGRTFQRMGQNRNQFKKLPLQDPPNFLQRIPTERQQRGNRRFHF